jgi:hypothetical protein
MNAQELAHWRYRIGAIGREQAHLKDSLNAFDKQISLYRSAALAGEALNSLGIEFCDYDMEIAAIQARKAELDQIIEINTYLLEEARYKVELGEL